jgi:hypothetical protein
VISEWTGLQGGSGRVDAARPTTTNAAGSGSSPADAGSITTSLPTDVVVFAVSCQGSNHMFGPPTEGTWQALVATTNPDTARTWYQAETAAGPVHPTVATQCQWDAAIAAYKEP